MAVTLDEGQTRQVGVRRRKPRPEFYNSLLGKRVPISEDFESFLILLGRPRTKAAMDWLKEAGDYGIIDADRDSLINKACENEIADAETANKEVAPIIDRFQRFRAQFLLTGFEAVPEVGMIIADLQRPMAELQNISARLNHRIQYATLCQDSLKNDGITPERSRQIDSWYTPLTAY